MSTNWKCFDMHSSARKMKKKSSHLYDEHTLCHTLSPLGCEGSSLQPNTYGIIIALPQTCSSTIWLKTSELGHLRNPPALCERRLEEMRLHWLVFPSVTPGGDRLRTVAYIVCLWYPLCSPTLLPFT